MPERTLIIQIDLEPDLILLRNRNGVVHVFPRASNWAICGRATEWKTQSVIRLADRLCPYCFGKLGKGTRSRLVRFAEPRTR